MKRFMLSILILSILIGYASLAQADWTDYYKWESIIWQDDGTEKGKLKIGTSKDATNGYDPICAPIAITLNGAGAAYQGLPTTTGMTSVQRTSLRHGIFQWRAIVLTETLPLHGTSLT